MHLSIRNFGVAFVVTLAYSVAHTANAQSVVSLKQHNGVFQLVRNGQPYDIKGAGVTAGGSLTSLAAAGGNSVRTWSTDNLQSILDEAQRHNLTVCVGLWLGHERHGFNYQNEDAVQQQLDECLAAVRKYKDHPAILLWGVGNEMEGDGRNSAIWQAIDHIASEIRKLDPSHPTMTVIAELGDNANKASSIDRYCPNIDIIGVNSYGSISSLAERYRKAGIQKPYVVTEHGPRGPWEVEKTKWGSPIEPSSTSKGESYANGYRNAVLDQAGLCLGSYAFVWGHKQETTITWFGMLLPDGNRLAAVDAMTEAWTGVPPKNRCPQITRLTINQATGLKPEDKINATLAASDPEHDDLTVKWVLRNDSGLIGVGGDAQAEEFNFPDAIVAKEMAATVTVPEGGGSYRLFAYVYDGNGGAAVANMAFSVDAPAKSFPAPKAKLPYIVYGDEVTNLVYSPSGYMGNAKAIRMTQDCADRPRSGKTCLKVEYAATGDWGGVLWQSPANDWDGAKPGGLNLTGAVALEFWARGSAGGETVNFMFGLINGDQPYHDTAKGELKDIRLTADWQKFRITLHDRDLTRLKTGFGWSLTGQSQPVTFFLDDILYVAE